MCASDVHHIYIEHRLDVDTAYVVMYAVSVRPELRFDHARRGRLRAKHPCSTVPTVNSSGHTA